MTTQAAPANTPLAERLSRAGESLRQAWPRLRDLFVDAVIQVRIYDKLYAGIMHALIFWGVTTQLIGTAIILMQMKLFVPFVELTFPRGNAYLAYELIMDVAGVAILVGVVMALFRRLVLRPKALESRWDDYYALVLLALIPIVGFTVEASRLLSAAPPWANWSPVGNALASLFRSLGMTPEQAASLHDYLFWTHVALGLALVASIPYTKLRHLFYTPLNILLRPQRKSGIPAKIENIEEAEILGVGNIREFTPQQLLSFDACVRCGRCEEACPVTASGADYSPRQLIQDTRQVMLDSLVYPAGKNGNGKVAADDEAGVLTFPESVAWSCTTCGACLQVCPAFVNPVDEIIDLRRYQSLTTGKLPKAIADTLRNMERKGNPWGMPPDDRIAWAEGLNIREIMPGEETDVLFYLGCASAYDERNKKVAQAFVRLLQNAGVDFAILGLDETCCGETARRMGHEYMFQMCAEQLIETLSHVKFNRIVTQCPHCFNTLKNEYPQLGANYTVQHYTEYLADLGKADNGLHWAGLAAGEHDPDVRISYHDSCYLGRYNQIYAAPRELLEKAQVNMVELRRRKENSLCCGGGGGQMWMEAEAETRINHLRLQDALDVRADIVATACPYCLLMFDDAIRSKGLGEQIQVLDIAEILDRQFAPREKS